MTEQKSMGHCSMEQQQKFYRRHSYSPWVPGENGKHRPTRSHLCTGQGSRVEIPKLPVRPLAERPNEEIRNLAALPRDPPKWDQSWGWPQFCLFHCGHVFHFRSLLFWHFVCEYIITWIGGRSQKNSARAYVVKKDQQLWFWESFL